MNRSDQLLVKFFDHSLESRTSSVSEMLDRRQDQPLVVRLGKVGLYKVADRLLLDTMIKRLVPNGYRYLGSGYEQLVLLSSDSSHVLKVVRQPTYETEIKAREAASAMQSRSDACQRHLGDHWLDTRFGVTPLGLGRKRYAITATQETIEPMAKFSNLEAAIAYSDSAEYHQRVGAFVNGLSALDEEEQLYPDILGVNNILLIRDQAGTERVCIVDTIPLSDEALAVDPLNNGITNVQFIRNAINSSRSALAA